MTEQEPRAVLAEEVLGLFTLPMPAREFGAEAARVERAWRQALATVGEATAVRCRDWAAESPMPHLEAFRWCCGRMAEQAGDGDG